MKQVYRQILLVLCCTFFFSKVNSQAVSNPGQVLIKNITLKSLDIAFMDHFFEYQTLSIPAKETKVIPCYAPMVVFSRNFNREPFIIRPNDSISLSLDAKKDLVLTAKSVERSYELAALKHVKNLMNPVRTAEESSAQSAEEQSLWGKPVEADSVYQARYKIELAHLDNYAKVNQLSASFLDLSKKYFFYKYLKAISQILQFKKFHNNELPIAFRDRLINLKQYLNADECLEMDVYQQFAMNYLFYLEHIKKPEGAYSTVRTEFSGSIRNFYLFSLLKGYYNVKKDLFKVYYEAFLSDCPNTDYKSYITNLYNFEAIDAQTSGQELMNRFGKRTSFTDLVKKHAGKTIYIDFWASWCNPCMDELPGSTALRKKLASRNVVFLYFSFDKNVNSWQSAVKMHGLQDENSFLVIGEAKSNLAKHFKVTTIPHYVLIDKYGKIMDGNAPRPTDPNLIKKIL